MFVCLWSPVWRTAADSLADLSPALLTVAPRVVTEERRGGLVWVDARGLDAERIAHSALDVLRGLGLANVHAGIGEVPVVAEVIATWGIGNRQSVSSHPEGIAVHPAATSPSSQQTALRAVSASPLPTPDSLGSLPISVLEPDPALATLL